MKLSGFKNTKIGAKYDERYFFKNALMKVVQSVGVYWFHLKINPAKHYMKLYFDNTEQFINTVTPLKNYEFVDYGSMNCPQCVKGYLKIMIVYGNSTQCYIFNMPSPIKHNLGLNNIKLELNCEKHIYECHVCKSQSYEKHKKCNKCKLVQYCSRECQMSDWENHKSNCY